MTPDTATWPKVRPIPPAIATRPDVVSRLKTQAWRDRQASAGAA